MYTTAKPLTLVPATEKTPAVVADKAFLCMSPFAPVAINGKLATTILFRAQRFHLSEDGTISPFGPTLDKAFTADQLAAARKSDSQLDGLLTQLEDLTNTLGAKLGL